ncbi:hypothetical protein Tco_0088649 [Tanacetum coccineum]
MRRERLAPGDSCLRPGGTAGRRPPAPGHRSPVGTHDRQPTEDEGRPRAGNGRRGKDGPRANREQPPRGTYGRAPDRKRGTGRSRRRDARERTNDGQADVTWRARHGNGEGAGRAETAHAGGRRAGRVVVTATYEARDTTPQRRAAADFDRATEEPDGLGQPTERSRFGAKTHPAQSRATRAARAHRTGRRGRPGSQRPAPRAADRPPHSRQTPSGYRVAARRARAERSDHRRRRGGPGGRAHTVTHHDRSTPREPDGRQRRRARTEEEQTRDGGGARGRHDTAKSTAGPGKRPRRGAAPRHAPSARLAPRAPARPFAGIPPAPSVHSAPPPSDSGRSRRGDTRTSSKRGRTPTASGGRRPATRPTVAGGRQLPGPRRPGQRTRADSMKERRPGRRTPAGQHPATLSCRARETREKKDHPSSRQRTTKRAAQRRQRAARGGTSAGAEPRPSPRQPGDRRTERRWRRTPADPPPPAEHSRRGEGGSGGARPVRDSARARPPPQSTPRQTTRAVYAAQRATGAERRRGAPGSEDAEREHGPTGRRTTQDAQNEKSRGATPRTEVVRRRPRAEMEASKDPCKGRHGETPTEGRPHRRKQQARNAGRRVAQAKHAGPHEEGRTTAGGSEQGKKTRSRTPKKDHQDEKASGRHRHERGSPARNPRAARRPSTRFSHRARTPGRRYKEHGATGSEGDGEGEAATAEPRPPRANAVHRAPSQTTGATVGKSAAATSQ